MVRLGRGAFGGRVHSCPSDSLDGGLLEHQEGVSIPAIS